MSYVNNNVLGTDVLPWDARRACLRKLPVRCMYPPPHTTHDARVSTSYRYSWWVGGWVGWFVCVCACVMYIIHIYMFIYSIQNDQGSGGMFPGVPSLSNTLATHSNTLATRDWWYVSSCPIS
jgi:hypothetical protein